ncbi:hypothetical protein OHA72_54760 [Dactylosporangium sp. NBC_01737]|uniref:hypothetical protein n=1 Tax=Dactylosporangium sp. NBC_01737 TaxID=2975959 RepID=UPI002E1075DC|nr:hypothetical protein OHA72_54760 [Dactylosporangium sp. NBC_01737]
MTAPRPPSWRGAPPAPQKRIPGDLPFVVRRSAGRMAVFLGMVFLAIWVLLTGLLAFGLLAGESPDRTGGDLVAVVALGFCALLAFAAVVAVAVRLVVAAGPVLALDHAGLWVRNSQAMWARAVWVPWESVERAGPRRVLLARTLVVTVGGGRVRYLVPLRLNDRTEAEIIATVARFRGSIST